MSQKKITGYTIFLAQVLGKGSYGAVYKGEKDKTKEACAIKVIPRANIDSDEYMKAALMTQIEVLKSLKSENIVGFFDVMESSHNYYIVQELCDTDLEKLLDSKKGKIEETQGIPILKEICNGFLAIVRQGLVHRDLKPANVLMSKGVVKLGDFGFAKKNPNRRVKSQTVVGTPMYMCLQILKGQPYTSKCDIWSLGFIFYEMLHGYTPWTGKTQVQLVKNIENKPLKINPNLSPNTINFLTRVLQKNESDRISWDELFLHPIFEKFFDKFAQENIHFQNRFKKVMADLRFTTNSQNINLKNHFSRLGFQETQELKFDQFKQFIQSVNPQITKQEEVFMFEKLDTDNNNCISIKQLQNQMEKHNISLVSKEIPIIDQSNLEKQSFQKNQICPLNASLQKRLRQCFINLSKVKKGTLFSLFSTYDTDKSGNLTINQFTKIIKRLDSNIKQQQIELVFDFIDVDKSKTITFDEFSSYYCKVNEIPLSSEVPPQYIMTKMKEYSRYGQQSKEGSNN